MLDLQYLVGDLLTGEFRLCKVGSSTLELVLGLCKAAAVVVEAFFVVVAARVQGGPAGLVAASAVCKHKLASSTSEGTVLFLVVGEAEPVCGGG